MRHFEYMLIWIFLVQSVRVSPVFPISPLILTLWTRSSSILIVSFLPILHPPSPPPPPVLTQHPTFSLSFYFLPPSLPPSFPWQHLFMAAVAWFKLKIPMIVKTLFHTGQWRTWARTHTHKRTHRGMYAHARTQPAVARVDTWRSRLLIFGPSGISFHDHNNNFMSLEGLLE